MEFKFPSRPIFSENLGIRSCVGRLLFKRLHLWANVEWAKPPKQSAHCFKTTGMLEIQILKKSRKALKYKAWL